MKRLRFRLGGTIGVGTLEGKLVRCHEGTILELVSRISHDMTLEPGDVIFCGTSLGVLPIKPGTEVEVEIDGIGTLRNVYG